MGGVYKDQDAGVLFSCAHMKAGIWESHFICPSLDFPVCKREDKGTAGIILRLK